MADYIEEYVHIPSDENDATIILCSLLDRRPEISSQVAALQVHATSSRAVLEALVKSGTFAGKISDDEALRFEIEAAEAGRQEKDNERDS